MSSNHKDSHISGGSTPPGVPEGGVPGPLSEKSRTKWRKDYRKIFGEVDDQFERRMQQGQILLQQGQASSRLHALTLIRDAGATPSSLPTPPGPMSPDSQAPSGPGAPNSQVPGTETSSLGSSPKPGKPGSSTPGVPRSQNRSEFGGPGSPDRSSSSPRSQDGRSPGSGDSVPGKGERSQDGRSPSNPRSPERAERSGNPGSVPERLNDPAERSRDTRSPEHLNGPAERSGDSVQDQGGLAERLNDPVERLNDLVERLNGSGERLNDPAERPYGPAERAANERTKWSEAYRSVFGEEPKGELAEERIRAAIRLYNPTRQVGRRQALEQVREGEEQTFFQAAMTERVVNKKDTVDGGLEGEPWLPLADESDLTLGAILLKMGRMEAELDYLQRFVVKLENQIHRTETRLGGMTPGLKSLRDAMKSIRETVLQSSKRIDALLPGSTEGDGPINRKELREMRARIEEERSRMLLEVDSRLEETERMIQASLHTRIAVLESWAKRIGKYLSGRGGRN